MRIKCVGILDKYGKSGTIDDLFQKYGLTSEAVFAEVQQIMNMK